MDGTGPIPFHAAQAARLYGGRPSGASSKPQITVPNGPAAGKPNPLVAGRVQATAGPLAPLDQVTLSTANTGGAGTTPNSFAMYTRAADRVEVATAVAIGRTIDRLG